MPKDETSPDDEITEANMGLQAEDSNDGEVGNCADAEETDEGGTLREPRTEANRRCLAKLVVGAV